MSMHDVRFPVAVSFGASGGVERRTEIVTLVSGHEERNTPWAEGRRRYDAGLGVRSLDDLDTVVAFFEARRGQLYAFRYKDWLDHKSCAPSAAVAPTDQAIGTGDGAVAAFQLVKRYASGTHEAVRQITRPVAGTVRVAVDGVEVAATVDDATGIVTLAAAPAAGTAVTAGFEYDVPVRFDTDRIEVSLAAFEAGELPSIPLVEVRV
ncbi:MAG: DUF2460 domain-containing protein [Pseudomonadota bacterium]